MAKEGGGPCPHPSEVLRTSDWKDPKSLRLWIATCPSPENKTSTSVFDFKLFSWFCLQENSGKERGSSRGKGNRTPDKKMSAVREQHAVSFARRLDLREREILRALFEYETLLTYQLRVLFFSSLRRCQDVMKGLRDLGLVERDTPSGIGAGRGQSMWTLTEDGLRVVAVLVGRARSQIEWMPRHSFHAADRHLAHTLGVNRLFVSLVEASLLHAAHGLEKWVPAKQVESRNNWVTHDGFGRYQHPGGACDLYFEYDRGTEWHDQLVRKLRGYLLMAVRWTEEGDKHFPNVLVLVPTEKRERAFDRALLAAVESLEIAPRTAVSLPFFIASEERLADEGVLGKVWRRFVPVPAERPLASFLMAERLSLVELPAHKTGPFDLDRCLGKRWIDAGARSKLRRSPSPSSFPPGEPPAIEESVG